MLTICFLTAQGMTLGRMDEAEDETARHAKRNPPPSAHPPPPLARPRPWHLPQRLLLFLVVSRFLQAFDFDHFLLSSV